MSRLIDEIKKYRDSFQKKVPKDIQEVMFLATQKLKEVNLSKNVPAVGSTFPNITLPNALKENIALDELLQDNDYLVINFYRGAWCPYCNLELQSLQKIAQNLAQYKASIVAISPQTPDSSLTTKEKNDLSFEVLSDKNNSVAKQLGLVFSLSEELRPIYKSFGIDIPKSNDENSYELPMPATFVINKNREILYIFVDENYTKRSEPQEILDIIVKSTKG